MATTTEKTNMERWQREVAERLARIEEAQQFFKDNIQNLPQSPACKARMDDLSGEVVKLRTFKEEIEKKVAYVGGIIIMLGLALPQAINWVFAHIDWKSP